MIEILNNSKQLVAMMRRPDFGGPLRFIKPQQTSWQDSLSLKPENLDKVAEHVAALVLKFPRGSLPSSQKMVYRKAYAPEMGTVLRAFANSLSGCPEIKGDPQKLLLTSRKLARYQNIVFQAGRAVNSAMDLRLVLGALQWYMLRAVLQKVIDRLESPDCTRAESDKLHNKFSKLLLNKEVLLQTKEQRKQQFDQQQKDLADQTSEVQKQTLVDDTIQAVSLNRPVDQKTLETAARYHFEIKQKQAADAATAAADAQGANARKVKR